MSIIDLYFKFATFLTLFASLLLLFLIVMKDQKGSQNWKSEKNRKTYSTEKKTKPKSQAKSEKAKN